VGEGNVSNH